MDVGSNKEILTQQSSNKTTSRGNTYGHYHIIENRWYQITDKAIRKYYVTKLPMSIFEEIEKEYTRDWSDVDIPNYLNYEKVEKEKLLKEITSPKIINVSLKTNQIYTNKY